MAFFTEIDEQVTALRDLLGEDAVSEGLLGNLSELDDEELVCALTAAANLARCAERIGAVGAGIAAARSTRDAGHAGLAQSRGHRSPAAFVQELTGSTHAEAAKQIRVGATLLQNTPTSEPATDDGRSAGGGAAPLPWHAPLGAALLDGAISSTQHDAVVRGLGDPPQPPEADAATVAAIREAWSLAAAQLVDEAAQRTVEELRAAARTIRDHLDPEGAERRFLERFENRSFRMWTDADGRHHGSFVFDDESALWVRTVVDAALRPRRGGPRFVDPDEKAVAQELIDDPRTNDQLSYDLVLDLLRAGTLADVYTVFGVRQAGLRLVRVVDTPVGDAGAPHDGVSPGDGAHSEDALISFPAGVADRLICNTGTVPITFDRLGNPLDVGREHRLFTPRQRIALAIRDGGCRWPGCDRPASYGEAHHIDRYSDGGRTDIDRGVLLCRFHHMNLHHGGWQITREGTGDFVLLDRRGRSFVLSPRLPLTYAWAGIDPPPRRFRPGHADQSATISTLKPAAFSSQPA